MMKYYGGGPATVPTRKLAGFGHFKGESGLFQDDHVLLEGFDAARQPYPEVFVGERTVRVPADTAGGEYKVWMGLYRRTGKRSRLDVETSLPVESRAVLMPEVLGLATQ